MFENDKKRQARWALLALILILVAAGIYAGYKYATPPAEPQQNDQQAFEDPRAEDPNWTRFAHNSGFYVVSYPHDLFTETAQVCGTSTGGPDSKIIKDENALALQHAFPYEWSDLKGDSYSEITDMEVEFCLFEASVAQLTANYEGLVQTVEVAGQEVEMVAIGAEGQGADIYYFAVDANKTLQVSHNYYSELYDQMLLEQADFIPKAEQEQVLSEILETLQII